MNQAKNIFLIAFLSIFFFLLISVTSNKNEQDFLDPAGDSKSYISLAKSLSEEGRFIRTEFLNDDAVETVRTPGYPTFLSLFSDYKNVIYIQNFLHIITSLLIYKLVKMRGNNKLAIFFLLLYLCNPLLISLSQLLLTESLSIFLITSALFLFLEKEKIFFPLVLIATLPLIRPAFLIVVVGFIFFNKILFREISIKKRFVMVLILILPSLFWIQRNYELTNQIIFSSITGMNLLEDTASGVMAINEDIQNNEDLFEIIDIQYEEKRYWSQILRNEVDLGETSRVISNAPGKNPHEVANAYQSYATKVIINKPLELSILMVRALVYNTLEPGDQIYNHVLNLNNSRLLNFTIIGINFFVTIFTFMFIFQTIKLKKEIDIEIIFYILLLTPLLLLATPNGRFGAPLFGIAIILCSKYFNNLKVKEY